MQLELLPTLELPLQMALMPTPPLRSEYLYPCSPTGEIGTFLFAGD